MADTDTEFVESGFPVNVPRRREFDTVRQIQVSPTAKTVPSLKKRKGARVLVSAICAILVTYAIFKLFFYWYPTPPPDPAVLHKRFLFEMEAQPLTKSFIVHDQTQMYEGDDHVDGPAFNVRLIKTQQSNLSVDLCSLVLAQLKPESTRRCVLWSQNGVETTSYVALVEGQSYYVFPKERLFLWPAVRKGFRQASTVKGISGIPIELETLSLQPRIFRIYNYISLEDVDTFLQQSRKLSMARSTGGLRRKETGAGDQISTRTSENAWDTDSAHAKRLKALAMDLLRIPHHDMEFLDGFQIVHYNPGQSYNTHSDWFGTNSGRGWNWNPAEGGVNRWATLFLYLSNVTLGGETMFPFAGDMGPTDNATQAEIDALKSQLFQPGAWENDIVDECRSKFRVVPSVGEAILFYHQSSTGKLDDKAQHAACPVLIGDKLGANLWIWNDKRWSAERAEAAERLEEEEANQGKRSFLATFRNEFGPVDVVWVGNNQEVLQFTSDKGQSTSRNSWKGHQFVVHERDGDKRVVTKFVMDPQSTHTYIITSGEL